MYGRVMSLHQLSHNIQANFLLVTTDIQKSNPAKRNVQMLLNFVNSMPLTAFVFLFTVSPCFVAVVVVVYLFAEYNEWFHYRIICVAFCARCVRVYVDAVKDVCLFRRLCFTRLMFVSYTLLLFLFFISLFHSNLFCSWSVQQCTQRCCFVSKDKLIIFEHFLEPARSPSLDKYNGIIFHSNEKCLKSSTFISHRRKP